MLADPELLLFGPVQTVDQSLELEGVAIEPCVLIPLRQRIAALDLLVERMVHEIGEYGLAVELLPLVWPNQDVPGTEHGGELQTRYAHLSGYAVAAGEQVHKGQLIGFVGSTGRSTGPHLHYEVRVAGEAVDPRPYMVATDLAVAPNASLGRGGPE